MMNDNSGKTANLKSVNENQLVNTQLIMKSINISVTVYSTFILI